MGFGSVVAEKSGEGREKITFLNFFLIFWKKGGGKDG